MNNYAGRSTPTSLVNAEETERHNDAAALIRDWPAWRRLMHLFLLQPFKAGPVHVHLRSCCSNNAATCALVTLKGCHICCTKAATAAFLHPLLTGCVLTVFWTGLQA